MIGYDTLLGSHYDRYYVEYYNFDDEDDISPSVFALPTSLKCQGFPGPGARHRALVNPMKEFIHSDDTHVHHQFDEFKKDHGKEYDSNLEHKERLHLFRQNLRYINSFNRQGKTFTLAINHLADRSDDELAVLRGKQKRTKTSKPNNGLPFDMSKYKRKDVPDSFDWRIYGAVTPVKDQVFIAY